MNVLGKNTSRWTAAFGMALIAILAAPQARAGLITDCMDPVLFDGADVNLVILPYAFDGSAPDLQLKPNSIAVWENEATRALSTLIQLDALYSLRYPASMAAIQLFTEDSGSSDNNICTAQNVRARIDPKIADGRGVVLLWGSVIERDGELFVQSYVQFYRKNRSTVTEFTIPSDYRKRTFAGGLPQSGLGFAPQILSSEDVGGIVGAAESARAISSEPGGNADRFLPDTPTKPFAFYVTGVNKEGWMQVRAEGVEDDNEGWIPAQPAWPLRSKLPELDFVEAAMGYIAAEIIRDEQESDHWAGPWQRRYAATRARSVAAIDRYLAASDTDGSKADVDSATAASIALAMKGALTLGDPRLIEGEPLSAQKDLAEAAGDLRESLTIVPYFPETWNMAAIVDAGLADADTEAPKRAVEHWRRALSLSPGNDVPAQNLATFYRALSTFGELQRVGISDNELNTRLRVLEGR